LRQGTQLPGLLSQRQPRTNKADEAKGFLAKWLKTFLPGG
jgi:hypothetical protein